MNNIQVLLKKIDTLGLETSTSNSTASNQTDRMGNKVIQNVTSFGDIVNPSSSSSSISDQGDPISKTDVILVNDSNTLTRDIRVLREAVVSSSAASSTTNSSESSSLSSSPSKTPALFSTTLSNSTMAATSVAITPNSNTTQAQSSVVTKPLVSVLGSGYDQTIVFDFGGAFNSDTSSSSHVVKSNQFKLDLL